jgi:hypothetical protein
MAESIAHFYDQFISRSMEGDKQTRSGAGVSERGPRVHFQSSRWASMRLSNAVRIE